MRRNFVKIFKQMKTTKKIILTGIACCLCVNGLFAGGLLTNTNQSVHFLRNPARNASIEIDAVYTNPAGLAMLSDGWHFSLNNQTATQTRTITSTFDPFALGEGGSATKVFEGKTTAPFIPSLWSAYKKGNWVFSGGVSVVGGGGSLTFDKGLPLFESQIAAPIAMLSSAANISDNSYTLDSKLTGTSMILGVQLGATYKINDFFSAFVGGRANFVNSGYEGYLRNVNIAKANDLTTYFTTAATMANGAAASLQPAIDGGFGNVPLNMLGLPAEQIAQMAAGLGITAEQIGGLSVLEVQGAFGNAAAQATGAAAGVAQISSTNLELNCKQSGWGITPILGFNFNYEKLNIGVKYEFITKLTVTNKEGGVNTTGIDAYNDGYETPYDIPAILAVGAQYDIIPSITVSASYNHFFESAANMANDRQQLIDGGASDYMLGAEWRINKRFLISAGGSFSRTGVTDDYQTDLNYGLNSNSLCFGGAVNITESLRVNLGCILTKYSEWAKPETLDYNGTGIKGTDVFFRSNAVFGIGVDYRF